MKHPLKRKTTSADAYLMVKVFIGCMKSQTIPHPESMCMLICKKIIKDRPKKKGAKNGT